MKAPVSRHPSKPTTRGEVTSATAPARRREDAVARLVTEEGQKASSGGRLMALVMEGRPITTRPPVAEVVKFTPDNWKTTANCWSLEWDLVTKGSSLVACDAAGGMTSFGTATPPGCDPTGP